VSRLLGVAAFLLTLGISALAVSAQDTITVEGVLSQGGLARGEAPPGTALSLEGRAVRVAPDGKFILGFSRD